MNVKGFIGGAGTGKTTSLLRELVAYLETNPLSPGQRVLALTFMHGSRCRLAERLSKTPVRRQNDCMTLDRFAWHICRRWRTRLRTTGGFSTHHLAEPDYDATCEAAGQILSVSEVSKWVVARYPVIVLDEFQDCAPVRLALAQGLHGRVKMFIAADDFQNLNQPDECPGVTWLRDLNVCEELTVNHRTADVDLIAAAHALRNGTPLPKCNGTSFKLISAPSAAVAASFISQTMAPATGRETVLLSAARQGSSAWVDNVIELVTTKQYGKQKAGPVSIRWEATADSSAAVTMAALGIEGKDRIINIQEIHSLPSGPLATQLKKWADHQQRVLGRIAFEGAEICVQVNRAAQHMRAFNTMAHTGRRAMTIHQAKNREFPVVIVLWPFHVVGNEILARRWLYNAITRAKRRAIVIVEDPKNNRLNAPPFAYP